MAAFQAQKKERGPYDYKTTGKYDGHKIDVDCWCKPNVTQEPFGKTVRHNNGMGSK